MRTPSLLLAACLVLPASAAPWPQFRGPNASGVADDGYKLPTEIGPERNVAWKVPLAPGHSSPAVSGDRLFVTGAEGQKLFTAALDPDTGKTRWRCDIPHRGLEKFHSVGNAAQPSPATDGQHVVSLFGSAGLFCHDRDGKQLWHLPLGPFKNDFGAGSSPLIVGGRVLLNQDHDTDSFLAAYDVRSGKEVWKTDRSEFPRGYATPVLWEVEGKRQVVVVGTLRVVGYDFDTGKEVWTVRGLGRIANMTPTVGGDGRLYVALWAPGGDETDRIRMEPFADVMPKQDRNKNGSLELDEVPGGPLKERFTQIDRDKDGHISQTEYETMRAIFEASKNQIVAIKPGGRGDVTATHVLWSYAKMLPYVPSPVYYKGHVYLVKNGGIVNCLDAATGRPASQERVPGSANYYSSPVVGDGKIYLVSQRGEATVISAEPSWKVLSKATFGEDVFATPAIADGRIYLRTAGHLYCFAEQPTAEAGLRSLFDGKTFAGWEGDTAKTWRIEDGAIVGGSLETTVPRNEFLCTTKTYGDFELRLKFKLLGDRAKVNAGIQFRTKRIPNHHEVSGYQADIGQHYWGALYDESRRNKVLATPDKALLEKVVKHDDWNEYVIRCEGTRVWLTLNGTQTVDYTETDRRIDQSGVIGLQVHGGAKAKVFYKDIRIAELAPKGN